MEKIKFNHEKDSWTDALGIDTKVLTEDLVEKMKKAVEVCFNTTKTSVITEYVAENLSYVELLLIATMFIQRESQKISMMQELMKL